MRVCDVLLSLVTTLIDLGLLTNCRRQKDTNKVHHGMPTPPTSSNNIYASPTREIVDPASDKQREKISSQEAKKIEKEVSLEKHIPDRMPNLRDDKDVESGPTGSKEQGGSIGDQGGNTEKTGEKMTDDDDKLSFHNTFMDIVIR